MKFIRMIFVVLVLLLVGLMVVFVIDVIIFMFYISFILINEMVQSFKVEGEKCGWKVMIIDICNDFGQFVLCMEDMVNVKVNVIVFILIDFG